MKKIIRDTLQNPKTGQWSRKNLTGFSSFLVAVVYVFYTTAFDKPVHEFVVAIFITSALTCLGISSWEKLNLPKNDQAS